MLFSEIYGSYFSAVSAILAESLKGELTERRIRSIVNEKCFGESVLSIPDALKNGDWPLMDAIVHEPSMPLTILEKRWLKALLADRRIRLFGVTDEGLEDIEPLFTPDMFDEYDRYADGDPYGDEGYIAIFRTLLTALREKRKLHIEFTSYKGKRLEWDCIPLHLEFSAKDDKFRLVTAGRPYDSTVNVSRITSAQLLGQYEPEERLPSKRREEQLIFELTDIRNALERVLMHFSHLRKETERTGENTYRVTLYYDRDDETEILIRILSFGPAIRVTSPAGFIEKLRERLKKQLGLFE